VEEKDKIIQELAILVFKLSWEGVEVIFAIFNSLELQKEKSGDIESQKWTIFYELIVLHLHLLDRMSFKRLPREEKEIFMGKLFKATWALISKDYKKKEVLKAEAVFKITFNKRQAEYGQYQNILPTEKEILKGTLLWEACGRISEILCKQRNAFIMMPLIEYLTDSLSKQFQKAQKL